jgi:hypothetical protein
MRDRTECLIPRAEPPRGKVRGALPRTPARETPPETPPPFPSSPCSRTVLAVQGALRKIFSTPENIFLRRAQIARPGRLWAVLKIHQ